MNTAVSLLPILAVLTIGVISPGPSFIMVAQTAATSSRANAVASAFGMAAGATLLSVAALLGLHTLFVQIPNAFLLLKAFGGIYLVYLGIRSWRNASRAVGAQATAEGGSKSLLGCFLLSTGVMGTNPKAAVQYGVIFSAMLPANPTADLMAALPLAVFALEASWYVAVAFGLSAPGPRSIYLSAKSTIDRVAGVVLGLLGAKLFLATR